MPGHPGFPGTAEVWHIETKGASAGYCPDGVEGGSGETGGGSPGSGQQSGSGGLTSSSDQTPNESSGTPQITPEDLEHQQIEEDPHILKGPNTLAGQEGAIFGDSVSDGVKENSDVSKGNTDDDARLVTSDNVIQMLVESSNEDASQSAPQQSPKPTFFDSVRATIAGWLNPVASSQDYSSVSWQSFQTPTRSVFESFLISF